eukprot:g21855.t1
MGQMSSNDIEIVMNLTGLELREWGVMASVDATGGEWIRAPGLPEPLQLIPWPRATRRGRGEQREEPQGVQHTPLKILELKPESSEVEILQGNLERICQRLNACGASVVSIIAVMGTYRTGKSFLLDLLARYLKMKAAEAAQAEAAELARREALELGLQAPPPAPPRRTGAQIQQGDHPQIQALPRL